MGSAITRAVLFGMAAKRDRSSFVIAVRVSTIVVLKVDQVDTARLDLDAFKFLLSNKRTAFDNFHVIGIAVPGNDPIDGVMVSLSVANAFFLRLIWSIGLR